MRSMFVAVLLVALLEQAVASDKVTLTLSINEIMWLNSALSSLDGHDRVVKDGQIEKVIREPYKLSTGVRLDIASDMTATRAVLTDVQSIIKTLVDNQSAIEKIGLEKRQIDLMTIDYDGLNLDTNDIMGSVISGLDPVLRRPKEKK